MRWLHVLITTKIASADTDRYVGFTLRKETTPYGLAE
jgi:hypothetical protein